MDMMKKTKIHGSAIILLVILFFSIPLTNIQANDMVAEQITVYKGQSFNINISLYPSLPIKSFELKIRFDPKILKANYVIPGDFFDGWETFNSPNFGVINNEKGTIINIYHLILGVGNTTRSGSLVFINFTALSDGTSNIEIYDAGITNETKYLDLKVSNGMVNVISNEYRYDFTMVIIVLLILAFIGIVLMLLSRRR